VVAANYLVMAVALGAWLSLRGEWRLSAPVLKLGALTGAFFIGAMLVFTQALREAGIGAVLTAFRISILLPIILGIWLWKEPVGGAQSAGVALALVGLVLMTSGARGEAHEPLGAPKTLLLLLLVFFSQSLSHVGISSVHHLGLDDRMLEVLFTIALTAGLLGAGAVVFKRHAPTRAEFAMGLLIGVYNLVNLVVILVTLSVWPRAVYFPVTGCAVVLLDNLFAHFFWRERLRLPALLGAALSAIAMLLVFLP